jgi:hypothetical protein
MPTIRFAPTALTNRLRRMKPEKDEAEVVGKGTGVDWQALRAAKGKIAEKEITITRAEGRTELCGIDHTFDTFEDAEVYLREQSHTVESRGGDKYDFEVIFQDGVNYTGMIIIVNGARKPLNFGGGIVDCNYSLKQHIRDHVEYSVDAEWNSRESRERWAEFLAKYAV